MATRFPVYPMPVRGLVEHPAFKALPSAGRGMLFSLLLHYWTTELQPIPTADDRLCAICQGHRPTWRHYKSSILRIFHDVRPEMEAYYKQRLTKHHGLRQAAISGNATRRLQAREAKRPASAISLGVMPQPVTNSEIEPRRRPATSQGEVRRTLRDKV